MGVARADTTFQNVALWRSIVTIACSVWKTRIRSAVKGTVCEEAVVI